MSNAVPPYIPSVSIVVPIYKVERYLRQCVDSILAQTLKDIEVILVDDGSPDACPAMVDAYAAADPRVVAVHQPNGGYGKAVNAGIELARGRYIGIIESDDWIEPDMYAKLLARAEETGADMVKCGFFKYDSTLPEGGRDTPWTPRYQNIDECPDGVFSNVDFPQIHIFHPSLWSYLYKAEFLKGLPFAETAGAAYQDTPFIARALCRARSIAVVKRYFYHYRMEASQDSSSMVNDARMLRMLDVAQEVLGIMDEEQVPPQVWEAVLFQVFPTNWLFCTSIMPRLRRQYFERMAELFSGYATQSAFPGKYFNKRWKKRWRICTGGHYGRFALMQLFKDLRHKVSRLFKKR